MKSKLISCLILVGLVFTIYSGTKTPPAERPLINTDYAKSVVMIVSPTMRSGGSGVIWRSLGTTSQVLTNKHICQLIQVGGVVITDDNATYSVSSFKVYPKHDLCMIEISQNLQMNTHLAVSPPQKYSPAIVAGHPSLLPTIISRGHFTSKMNINLIVGIEKCDGEEDPKTTFLCLMMGGKPIIRPFASQVASTLIMPGSSGSPVFNDKGEISGVIFAGPGDGLGYSFMVPYEFVVDFINKLEEYPVQRPDPSLKPKNLFKGLLKMRQLCFGKRASVGICGNIQDQSIKFY